MKKTVLRIGGVAYLLLMLWLLFGQRLGQIGDGDYLQQMEANLNLLPLDTVRRYIWVLSHSKDGADLRHAVINLAGNVAMFVPLGFFLPALWKKPRHFGWFLLFVIWIISAVELLQLVTLLGSCDVDDLILNAVGAFIGFGLWKLLPKSG